jgi:Leucine-rich repeat (LRR) protein/tRNA A-37 threonylcarbamoyl transferase component Bud32
MTSASVCPNDQQLRQLLSGKVLPSSSEVFAVHLARCERCGTAMEKVLAGDPLMEALRGQATLTAAPSPADQLLIGRLLRLAKERSGSSGRQAPTEAGSEERTVHNPDIPVATPATTTDRFDFLAPAQAGDEMGRLGGYRVLRVLGAGGMGVVFLAEDVRLKRKVALKVIRPEVANKPGARERFLREAQAAALLEHENIVTIYQVDEAGGVPFLAMQWLKGMSLEDRLQSGRPMTAAQIVWLGKQIAKGLAAAHEAGLVHRDVKPANLWLEPAGGGRIKILDFGLAHLSSAPAELTRYGTLLGTPGYLAPEQARGERASPACDLFSLGCVLYRLGTGKLPFSGSSVMAMLAALASDEAVPVAALNAELPPPLANLVMELLAKDPAKRPASAREAADRLEAIGKAAPTVVSAPQAIPVARIAAADAVAVAAAIPVVEPPAAVAVTEPVVRPGPPPSNNRRKRIALIAAAGAALLVLIAVFRPSTRKPNRTNREKPSAKREERKPEPKLDPAVAADDRRAAEWVLAMGGNVSIRMQGRDKGIARGKSLPPGSFRLICIDLGKTKLTDAGLARLKGLVNLQRLWLSETQVSDAGLAHLAGLTSLAHLGLGATQVKGPGLAHLAGLINLTDLTLYYTELRDAGLAHLAKQTSLTILNLGGTRISNAGLAHLAALTNLTTLHLADTGVTDSGLAHLEGLTNLTLLELSQTRITSVGLVHLKGLTHLEVLDLARTRVSDSGLVHLAGLTALTELNLGYTRVGNAGLEHLKGLTNLQSIRLENTEVSDAGMKHLAALPRLENLSVSYTRVSDAGMEHLKGLSRLRILTVRGTQVSNAGLEHVKGMTGLTHLHLHETRVSDEGLKYLAGLTNLGELRLDDTRVTNAGLTSLHPLRNLLGLGLSNTRITDAGVEHLVKLPKLTDMNLEGTRISPKGFATLKQAFPKTELTWSEPNRSAAEAVLALGGSGQMLVDGAANEQPIQAGKLPAEYFRLTRVSLTGVRKPLAEVLPALGRLSDPDFDRLEALDLSGATITGDDLALLESLKRLKELSLARTAITDAALVRLKPLTGLKRLTLDGAAINGSGLAALADLPELTELRLGCPAFTGAFAHRLADLKRLKVLDLTGSKVSKASVTALRKALPKCKIIGP